MSLNNLKLASDNWKHQFRVGIFGSFAEKNYPILEQTRIELNNMRYNSRLSIDLEDSLNPGEDRDAFNTRVSRRLLAESEIHIFFIFFETDGEHNINQSASMELENLCTNSIGTNVLVLFEKGATEQQRAGMLGLLATYREIDWGVFNRNRISQMQNRVIQFCDDVIIGYS